MSERSEDYVIGREITTVLKIDVDNVILELSDSCDYFASYGKPFVAKLNPCNICLIL